MPTSEEGERGNDDDGEDDGGEEDPQPRGSSKKKMRGNDHGGGGAASRSSSGKAPLRRMSDVRDEEEDDDTRGRSSSHHRARSGGGGRAPSSGGGDGKPQSNLHEIVVAGKMFKKLLSGKAGDEDGVVKVVATLLQGMTPDDAMNALVKHGGLTLTDPHHIALLQKVVLHEKDPSL